MNLLFNHNNIYRLKDDAKIYIEGKNSVDNFLHSKEPHPFPDTTFAIHDRPSIQSFRHMNEAPAATVEFTQHRRH